MAPPSRGELRRHLIQSHIAGVVATSRENNLKNFEKLSSRDPAQLFGQELTGTWSPGEVLALMAQRCGVSPDPAYREGHDTIDPDRTISRLDAMAERLRKAAERHERVFVATGHPKRLRQTHAAIAEALHMAGCTLIAPLIDRQDPGQDKFVVQRDSLIGYRERVGVLTDTNGTLLHTHSPLPMQAVLRQLSTEREAFPDLVVADHGWAGAAGQANLDVVGFADSNDPALFVGEAEGRVLVSVPLDDNVAPELYTPLNRYLLYRAGLPCP